MGTDAQHAPDDHLHLAPPFRLDDYTPRYMKLSSRDAAFKQSAVYAHLGKFNLCPRLGGVDWYEERGMCFVGEKAKVNVIMPHFGECGLLSRHVCFRRED